MKKIKIYLCSLVLLSLFACNDYLDVKPKNLISLETLDDVKSMMSSYFYGITGNNDPNTKQAVKLDGRYIFFPFNMDVSANFMFYGDNIVMKDIPNAYYAWNYYEKEYYQAVKWEAYDFSSTFWNETYNNIGYFNIVLDALKKIGDKSSKEYLELYCETKMLRTLMFFNILKFYAPYDKDKYGIPITTSSFAIQGSARSTQTEVYKFLLDELNSVKELDFNATEWNVFYSKEKLSALFSQIYWFKAESAAKEEGDWKNAADYANEVLKGRSLLSSSSTLNGLFKTYSKGFNQDNPYSLLIVANGRLNKSNYSAPWGTGSRTIPITSEFASLYDANDIRLSAYFDSSMRIIKWSPSYFAKNVVPMWRVAEFKLIAAEAFARQGDDINAAKYLNEFKQTRIPGYTNYEGTDILDEILRERRKEFCFEFGSRWIDLKRMNKGFSRTGISDEITNSEDREMEFVLEDGDYRFALPIPQFSELSVNNNIEQNPGWELK